MKGSLKLQNKSVFEGVYLNRNQSYSGDIVFYTGMSNFQTFLSDPSLKGKIVVCTFSNVLNTKIDETALESEAIQAAAIITQQMVMKSEIISGTLAQYCLTHNIPVLMNVDTRSVLKEIREAGEMIASLYSDEREVVSKMHIKASPTMRTPVTLNESAQSHVVILDFGVKKSLLLSLLEADFKITIIHPHTSIEEINQLHPNGVVFSGGPGHPKMYEKFFPVYKQLCESYPIIGFGLGHQIIALSFGAKVERLPIGHRNFKYPVIDTHSNKVYVTTQNHEYEINDSSLQFSEWEKTFVSLENNGIEGLVHKKLPIQSYQFHFSGLNKQLEHTILATYQTQLKQYEGVYIYA